MVASGDAFGPDGTNEGFVQKVEVIDLLNSSTTCKDWADLPDDLGRTGAFGGFIEEGLLICCGYFGDFESASDCLHITDNSTVMTPVSFEFGLLNTGSVVLDDNKLFVSGGLGRYFLVNCLVQPLILRFFFPN